MKVTRCGDRLVQLTLWPAVFPMNCVVVAEADGLTLVDSTMRSPVAGLEQVARDLGQELRRIVLTHAHGDHVGGVGAVRRRFPGVEVSISKRDARLLAGDKSLEADESQAKIKGSFVKIDWEPDRSLEPGDRVGSLEVVPSPGHTPGHVALLDTRDRTLIAGDAFQTRGGLAVAGIVRPLFPFVALGTWDKPTALASATELRKLEPARLLVGHGDPLDDPGGRLDAAIETARRAVGDGT